MFQVVLTRVCDPYPNQVIDMRQVDGERAAEALRDQWLRRPGVQEHRERVFVLRSL